MPIPETTARPQSSPQIAAHKFDRQSASAEHIDGETCMATVLVIDDDRSIPRLVEGALRDSDIRVLPAATAAEGIALIQTHDPDVILLDVMLPDMDGLEAFREIHKLAPKVPVIFITAGAASDTAIEAMKLGATDYLVKPLELAKVQEMIRQALEIRRWMNVPVKLVDGVTDDGLGENLIGVSPQMQEVYKAIGRVAPQDVTVLLLGESGSGKELVARAIYHHSRRADNRFLAVNCAALTETLLESELFGHERGSFTGANTQRIGKFEQSQRRNAVPRRNRRYVAVAAEQSVARAAGAKVRARRRNRNRAYRCSHHHGHQSQLGKNGRRGRIPRRLILSA